MWCRSANSRKDAELLRDEGTDASSVIEVKERIEARYRKRGYWRVQVAPAARVGADQTKKEVMFQIREGEGSRVASLRFPGRTVFRPDRLKAEVYRAVRIALIEEVGQPGADPQVLGQIVGDSSLRKPRDSVQPVNTAPDPEAIYLESGYEAGSEAIADLYRSRGYGAVQVSAPKVAPRPDSTLLDVGFEIKEGPQWRVKAVTLSGNVHMTPKEIFSMTGYEPMPFRVLPFSFDRVERARLAILDAYRDRGYLYASVETEERAAVAYGDDTLLQRVKSTDDISRICAPVAEGGGESCELELAFRIVEGPRVKVRSVILRGADRTRRRVVREELVVQEEQVLTSGNMSESRDNLLRLGVFERVAVRPIDEETVAADKDVIVELRERKAYSLELGGGASTAQGVRVFAGFSNNNFLGSALRLQINAKTQCSASALLAALQR